MTFHDRSITDEVKDASVLHGRVTYLALFLAAEDLIVANARFFVFGARHRVGQEGHFGESIDF